MTRQPYCWHWCHGRTETKEGQRVIAGTSHHVYLYAVCDVLPAIGRRDWSVDQHQAVQTISILHFPLARAFESKDERYFPSQVWDRPVQTGAEKMSRVTSLIRPPGGPGAYEKRSQARIRHHQRWGPSNTCRKTRRITAHACVHTRGPAQVHGARS